MASLSFALKSSSFSVSTAETLLRNSALLRFDALVRDRIERTSSATALPIATDVSETGLSTITKFVALGKVTYCLRQILPYPPHQKVGKLD